MTMSSVLNHEITVAIASKPICVLHIIFKASDDDGDLPVNVELLDGVASGRNETLLAQVPNTSEVKKKRRRKRHKYDRADADLVNGGQERLQFIPATSAGNPEEVTNAGASSGGECMAAADVEETTDVPQKNQGITSSTLTAARTVQKTSRVYQTTGARDSSAEDEAQIVPVTDHPALSKRESVVTVCSEYVNSSARKYSHFDFLANSMIITDVTTEKGTITVKECSAYEGIF